MNCLQLTTNFLRHRIHLSQKIASCKQFYFVMATTRMDINNGVKQIDVERSMHMWNCGGHADRMVYGNQFVIRLKEMFANTRKKHNLTNVEMQILSYLNMAEETDNTSKAICQNMHMNKAMVSKTLDGLSKRNLVCFKTDENDRRYVHYYLTEEAKPITEDFQSVWDYLHSNLFVGFDEDEIAAFFKMCRRIHENMMKIDEQSKSEESEEQGK